MVQVTKGEMQRERERGRLEINCYRHLVLYLVVVRLFAGMYVGNYLLLSYESLSLQMPAWLPGPSKRATTVCGTPERKSLESWDTQVLETNYFKLYYEAGLAHS